MTILDKTELIAQWASEVREGYVEEATYDGVVRAACEVIPDAEFVSMTIRTPDGFETLSSTSALATQADELQYTLTEGPCVEAALTGEWIRSGHVRTDPRWLRWGPQAAELGVVSLLSVPLYSQDRQIGALNMYATSPGRFVDRDEIDLALIFAIHATTALTASRLANGLEIAVSSRHLIGVAQGVLRERYGLTLDQSFALLRRISSHENIKIAALARLIIDAGSPPAAEPTPDSIVAEGGRPHRAWQCAFSPRNTPQQGETQPWTRLPRGPGCRANGHRGRPPGNTYEPQERPVLTREGCGRVDLSPGVGWIGEACSLVGTPRVSTTRRATSTSLTFSCEEILRSRSNARS